MDYNNYPLFEVTREATCYPRHLLGLEDMPETLYVRCKDETCLSLLNTYSIAVVGTREPTELGKRMAESVARIMAADGYTIIAGLALGIDTKAHQGALNAPAYLKQQCPGEEPITGKTCAVLARIDRISPAENTQLALDILESGGLLISEHGPDTKFAPYGEKPQKGELSYPRELFRRDRLQAALAFLVIPVQTGHYKYVNGSQTGNLCGTMHTCQFAHTYGRAMAIPRSALVPEDQKKHPLAYEGLDWLLHEKRAIPFTIKDWRQDLADLFPQSAPVPEEESNPEPAPVVESAPVEAQEVAAEPQADEPPAPARYLENGRPVFTLDEERRLDEYHRYLSMLHLTTEERQQHANLVTSYNYHRAKDHLHAAAQVSQELDRLFNRAHLRALTYPVNAYEEYFFALFTDQEHLTSKRPPQLATIHFTCSPEHPAYQQMIALLTQLIEQPQNDSVGESSDNSAALIQ